ncbi:hypothetical protein VTL71DRAFT_15293 [Oculimacula yallundae]|uniref:BRCT domain-containing protein n=1 Tax=Oculimacula yallundae TaxID=86028 RepID=A0ABR4CG68_9HELO
MAPTKATYKKTCAVTKKIAPNPITARKTKTEKPQKQIFRGLTMSSAGVLRTIKGEASLEEIQRWLRYHGGVYEKEVTNETTHLICSIEEYKKGGEQVRKAWKLGTKKCKIVVFDWLEDSLHAKPKGKLSEKAYSLDRTILNMKKMNADKVREYRQKFAEGVRVSKELSNGSLYHIYYDDDAFEYKVMLSRIRLDGKTMIEKYTLYLFESHSKSPPIYMFGAKLSRTSRPLTYYRQDCVPMDFATAFHAFKKFFKEKTGINWDDRLERIIPKKIENGKEIEFSFFKYLPPIHGRPVGLLPYGYVRPEDRPMAVPPTQDQIEDVGYDTNSEVGDDDEGTSIRGSGEGSTASGSAQSNTVISISSDEEPSCFSNEDTPSILRDTPSDAAGSPDGAHVGVKNGAISVSSDEGAVDPWRDIGF